VCSKAAGGDGRSLGGIITARAFASVPKGTTSRKQIRSAGPLRYKLQGSHRLIEGRSSSGRQGQEARERMRECKMPSA
jgi:hypothetical protein